MVALRLVVATLSLVMESLGKHLCAGPPVQGVSEPQFVATVYLPGNWELFLRV